MATSIYLSNILLDSVLGNQSFVSNSTLYCALFTTVPTSLTDSATEVSGGSYARVSVTNNLTNWPAASARSKKNATAISFPTASASWGTIVGYGFYDASSGGNLLFWGTFTSVVINNGDHFAFDVNGITASES